MNNSQTSEGQVVQQSAPVAPSAPTLTVEQQMQQIQLQMIQMQNQKQPVQQVIVNQQGPSHRHNPALKDTRKWQGNIFNICSAGCCSCMQAFMCPVSMMASTRSRFDGSNACFTGCCMTPCAIRNIVRSGYGIRGNCCSDLCYVTTCLPCAAIQMENEVQIRGPNRQNMH